MIVNRVKDILQEKGLTAAAFARVTNIARNTSYSLARDPGHFPNREVLDAICTTFNLQPGDVLVCVPDSEDSIA